ncbi:hypothetical protein DEO72_LG10g1610 [Vigna unguiculata]|uniref:Uncharacterized protein n=1 Tax=Vigna unguiculata TaxID=3917 RepID=A0A4D6N963_VIGUN|nr:hypothetical protein DEO72_LG10g1610 [Vigna unguiculata]
MATILATLRSPGRGNQNRMVTGHNSHSDDGGSGDFGGSGSSSGSNRGTKKNAKKYLKL